MRTLRSAGLVAIVLLAVATAVQAHHSTTASNSSKTVTVTGVVARVQWTNPHVIVSVNVPNPSDPSQVLYAFESASPNALEGAGWNRTALRAGDKITIDYAPFRDGKKGGLWILGRRSDGMVLSSRSGPTVSQRRPPTEGAAPAASGRCPRAEVVEVMPKASAKTRPVAYRNETIHVSRVPLSTLSEVVEIEFSPPWAIGLTFTPEVGEKMQRMTARPNFPMAFVVDNDAMVSVVLKGGFGIGKDGLKITTDSNQGRVKNVYDTLSRCVAQRSAK